MKITFIYLTVLVNLLLERIASEQLPEIGSNVCQSWKFDVIDGEYKEYLGNIVIDVENAGQVPIQNYEFDCHSISSLSAGIGKLRSLLELSLGKHIKADAKSIKVHPHTAGLLTPCMPF